jgi:hypothetical protein
MRERDGWVRGYLFAVLLEESRGVHSVCNRATDDGEPVEDHGRLVGVLEENLLQDVEDDGNREERRDRDADLRRSSQLRELLGQRSRDVVKEAHAGSDAARNR